MEIIGDRKFVEIPGQRQHELPPLLVHTSTSSPRLDKVMDMAGDIVQSEDLIDETGVNDTITDFDLQRRKMDLAVNLVEQYLRFLAHWHWGDGIVEWIRQCETTFLVNSDLRNV